MRVNCRKTDKITCENCLFINILTGLTFSCSNKFNQNEREKKLKQHKHICAVDEQAQRVRDYHTDYHPAKGWNSF